MRRVGRMGGGVCSHAVLLAMRRARLSLGIMVLVRRLRRVSRASGALEGNAMKALLICTILLSACGGPGGCPATDPACTQPTRQ